MKKLFIIAIVLQMASCVEYKYTPVSHNNNFSLKEVDFSKDFNIGESCAVSQNAAVFDGSRSIIDAAKNGNIKTVVFVDHKKVKEFLQPAKFCTVVYGH